MEIFVLSINISKVWQRHLFKLCKLCKQEVHFKLIYMQTPCHAKTPSTGIFLSQTEPMMCSTELKGQRGQAGVLNLTFPHLDSTRPLPFMIIKPIYIEKLYREDCHIKLSRMSDFQSTVPLQRREGAMSSGRTWRTFMSHKSIKSSPITSSVGKTTKIHHMLSCLLAKNFKNVNVDKVCSPIAYRLASKIFSHFNHKSNFT